MPGPDKTRSLEIELAAWLLSALERHCPRGQIRSTMVSRFGLTEDEADEAEERARAGILKAISGSRKQIPDFKTDVIGHTTFNLVWSTFHQNSFFDKRRTPSSKWLEWKKVWESGSAAERRK